MCGYPFCYHDRGGDGMTFTIRMTVNSYGNVFLNGRCITTRHHSVFSDLAVYKEHLIYLDDVCDFIPELINHDLGCLLDNINGWEIIHQIWKEQVNHQYGTKFEKLRKVYATGRRMRVQVDDSYTIEYQWDEEVNPCGEIFLNDD